MRLSLTMAAVLLGVCSGTASGQSLADCRTIPDNAQRLACYDGLAAGGDRSFAPQLRPQGPAAAPADASFAAAERAIKGGLSDPGSAKFIGLQRRPDAVCGFVNARGPSGGYTGSKLFVHVISTGETHVLDQPEDSAAGQGAQAAYAGHCK